MNHVAHFFLTGVNTFEACFKHTGEKMKRSKWRLWLKVLFYAVLDVVYTVWETALVSDDTSSYYLKILLLILCRLNQKKLSHDCCNWVVCLPFILKWNWFLKNKFPRALQLLKWTFTQNIALSCLLRGCSNTTCLSNCFSFPLRIWNSKVQLYFKPD